MNYREYLESKRIKTINAGFTVDRDSINKNAFDFQKDIICWALKKGRSAVFADCGLGKTIMQLEWAQKVHEYTDGNILILAPLSVSKQTRDEGQKFGIEVNICRSQEDVKNGINITNYEMLEHFESDKFTGIVIDESSILKSFTSSTRNMIIEKFQHTPYKLACTATPSPNDFMELGNHSEFLGVMSRTEMLSTYFIHDGGDTAKWRLKGHAELEFWKWIATWAICIKSPADLGYRVEGYELPKLNFIEKIVESDVGEFELVVKLAETLGERREARKESMDKRVSISADIVNNSSENFLVWCDFNAESELLKKEIADSVEVKGSDKPEHKSNSGIEFAKGNIKALVSKPSIFGFGMNFQKCNNMIFCGLSDSYEMFYQAVRRCWRYGQKKEVNVYIIISEKERNVLDNIKRKQSMADKMSENMVSLMKDITLAEIKNTIRITTEYKPNKEFELPEFLKGVV